MGGGARVSAARHDASAPRHERERRRPEVRAGRSFIDGNPPLDDGLRGQRFSSSGVASWAGTTAGAVV